VDVHDRRETRVLSDTETGKDGIASSGKFRHSERSQRDEFLLDDDGAVGAIAVSDLTNALAGYADRVAEVTILNAQGVAHSEDACYQRITRVGSRERRGIAPDGDAHVQSQ
jgi:hypothetical protein